MVSRKPEGFLETIVNFAFFHLFIKSLYLFLQLGTREVAMLLYFWAMLSIFLSKMFGQSSLNSSGFVG
jgi:hypothetical protein